MQKTQQTTGPVQCIYFKYSLWLEPDHVWVSGLEHERIALSSAPSPASPAQFTVQRTPHSSSRLGAGGRQLPNMAKPESQLPARRQGINYNQMGQVCTDGFIKTVPFSTKAGSPRSLLAAQRPSFCRCLPYFMPDPCHPFQGGPGSNCNPDMNSRLKITLEPPSSLCLHPGWAWKSPSPASTLICG